MPEEKAQFDIKQSLRKIRKRIDTSSGCGYLYHHFDELLKRLDLWEKSNYEYNDLEELIKTIKAYAFECKYVTFGSIGWKKYAARSFFCADNLLRFVHSESERDSLDKLLSMQFDFLIDSDAIIFLEKHLLLKYLLSEENEKNLRHNYKRMIERATHTASLHHPRESDAEYLAYRASKFAYEKITEYIEKYEDYSCLMNWCTALNTVRLADIWHNFPVKYIRNLNRNQGKIERIERYLDDSLELHLKLWYIWFDNNKYELLRITDTNDLIEILEVTDDDEFYRILNELSKIQGNEKVRKILEHFTNDDEDWIVELSKRLLSSYQ